MADPLRHEDLTNKGTRSQAYRLTNTLFHVTEGEPLHAGLAALVSTFVAHCKAADLDETAVFEQIADALHSGYLAAPKSVIADVEAQMSRFH
jgi:hypothetical protein